MVILDDPCFNWCPRVDNNTGWQIQVEVWTWGSLVVSHGMFLLSYLDLIKDEQLKIQSSIHFLKTSCYMIIMEILTFSETQTSI